jgi:excisionase family DNA binding protein
VIGKPVALIQIPNQRLFGPSAAAKYLGICADTLYKITALGQIAAYDQNGRRVYRLEDLDAYVESLPEWHNGPGGKSKSATSARSMHATT